MISFYVRTFLVLLWLAVCSTFWLIASLFLWGNKNLITYFFRSFGRVGCWLLGIKIDPLDKERFHDTSVQPCVYLGNHQSGLDVLTFGCYAPIRTVFIAKKQILYYPFIGVFFKAAGVILIDRKNHESAMRDLKKAARNIREANLSVAMMPEGTRNKGEDTLLPFKKGAFHLAIQAQVPLVCYVGDPVSKVFSREKKKMVGKRYRFHILPPISTEGLTEKDVDSLMLKTRELMETAYQELRTT